MIQLRQSKTRDSTICDFICVEYFRLYAVSVDRTQIQRFSYFELYYDKYVVSCIADANIMKKTCPSLRSIWKAMTGSKLNCKYGCGASICFRKLKNFQFPELRFRRESRTESDGKCISIWKRGEVTMKNNNTDAFFRKIWLLYFNKILLKNNVISQQDYRSMQYKILSLPR